MKAELSHHGFINDARYSGVYLQQGTMITDRDWNALCDRLKSQIEGLGRKSIASGVPKSGGLFSAFGKSSAKHWSATFSTNGGCVSADGLLAQADRRSLEKPFSYENQRDLPLAPPLTQPTLVYADIWDQVVTAFDASDLLDPGLHGAHTSFTTRRIVQIKQCAKEMVVETPCGLQPDPDNMPAIGTGRMSVALRNGPSGVDNCDPCAESVNIDGDVGNYLFRVEVHSVEYESNGIPSKVTLKWSRENGATRYKRRDDGSLPQLDPGYAYEFFTETTELYRGLHPTGFASNFVVAGELLHGDLSSADPDSPHIRRWDGFGEFEVQTGKLIDGWDRERDLSETGAPGNHGLVVQKDGKLHINLDQVTITLAIGKDPDTGEVPALLAGDYWLALARTRAEQSERIRMLSELPIGIQHHYCIIGVCEADGQGFKSLAAADKRRLNFPTLGCIQASDVGYDSAKCDYARSQNAQDVQEALDAFCKRLQPPYHALRMSQGTGQEAPLGKRLPGPIEVIVEDQNGHPVKNADVRFTALEPKGGPNGFPVDMLSDNPSMTNVDNEIHVRTDQAGRARAYWRLEKVDGYRAVQAALDDSLGKNSANIIFAAESEIKQEETKDLPLIEKVEWMSGKPFQNDAIVESLSLQRGFRIHFTEDIQPKLLSNDVVSLVAEIPLAREGEAVVWHEIIVCGNIVDADQRSFHYLADPKSLGFLIGLFRRHINDPKELPDCAPKEGLRFRIRLRGKFILDKEGNRQLDGMVPGIPDGARIALDFKNAGAGHPSDFDAWFYLGYKEFLGGESDNRVDINKASASKLRSELGISQASANKLIAGRPWRSVNDLIKARIDDRLAELKHRLKAS